MTKTRILTIAVITLIVVNISVVTFFVTKRGPHPPRPKEPKNFIIQQLGFDDVQIKEYQGLIDVHKKEVQKMEAELNENRKLLYSMLKTGNAPQVEYVAQAIGNGQKQIELIHYRHFLDIKSLCTADQIPKFDELTEDLAKLFNAKLPPKRR